MQFLVKFLFAFAIVSTLLVTSCAPSSYQQTANSKEEYEEVDGLNTRRLEKNIDKYADEIGLTNKQVKSLKRIERRYAKKGRKLKSKGNATRKNVKNLQEEKREVMLSVLTNQQQKKLQELTKAKKFNFFGLFE